MNTTVVVTWMDGTQETYACYTAQTDGSGANLILTQRMHSGQPKRVIPLASVRIYTVDER
jgi:hypothetical protein